MEIALSSLKKKSEMVDSGKASTGEVIIPAKITEAYKIVLLVMRGCHKLKKHANAQ